MADDELVAELNSGDPTRVARAWSDAAKRDIWAVETGYLMNALDTLADAWLGAITPPGA